MNTVLEKELRVIHTIHPQLATCSLLLKKQRHQEVITGETARRMRGGYVGLGNR